ncbi:uncharacterized protein LOC111862122 isoform X2 [Cryptotermes secundus]|nr:uncharacterized protein LOC111862122 isoform X2 [Cryptotermes secundus]
MRSSHHSSSQSCHHMCSRRQNHQSPWSPNNMPYPEDFGQYEPYYTTGECTPGNRFITQLSPRTRRPAVYAQDPSASGDTEERHQISPPLRLNMFDQESFMQAADPLSLRRIDTSDTHMDGRPHSGAVAFRFSPHRNTGEMRLNPVEIQHSPRVYYTPSQGDGRRSTGPSHGWCQVPLTPTPVRHPHSSWDHAGTSCRSSHQYHPYSWNRRSFPVRQNNQDGHTLDHCHCPGMFLQTPPTRFSHQPAAMVPESIPATHLTDHAYAQLFDSEPYSPHYSCPVFSPGTSSALDLRRFSAGPQATPTYEGPEWFSPELFGKEQQQRSHASAFHCPHCPTAHQSLYYSSYPSFYQQCYACPSTTALNLVSLTPPVFLSEVQGSWLDLASSRNRHVSFRQWDGNPLSPNAVPFPDFSTIACGEIPQPHDEAVLRSPHFTQEDDSEDDYFSTEFLQPERPGILSDLEIDQLPSYKFNTDSCLLNHTSCVVCMSDFEAEQMIRVLPCLHHFHIECIDMWLKCSATCPICRDDISQYFTGGD